MFRLSLFPALSLRRSTKAGNGKIPLVKAKPKASFPNAKANDDDAEVMRRVSLRVSDNRTGSLTTASSEGKTA